MSMETKGKFIQPYFLYRKILQINFFCRKMGSTIPFRRKSSDIENQETEKKINGKDSVFKIVYKQVG